MRVLKSTEDASVNFVTPQEIGFTEARYVRRGVDYFTLYVSSQTGCNRGCKFCHLTAMGQTDYVDVEPAGFFSQAREVLDYYRTQPKAAAVNYSWMARGEALANVHMLTAGGEILAGLAELAEEYDLIPKFNISTIMPRTLRTRNLARMFSGYTPTIYYSLYSMDEGFRSRWLPGALDADLALDMLAEYQSITSKIVKLHWAFIKGENDSLEDMARIADAVSKRGLIVDVNVVRYNPFSPTQGEEPDELTIRRNAAYLQERVKGHVKVINRIGFDVKASCGMFVPAAAAA